MCLAHTNCVIEQKKTNKRNGMGWNGNDLTIRIGCIILCPFASSIIPSRLQTVKLLARISSKPFSSSSALFKTLKDHSFLSSFSSINFSSSFLPRHFHLRPLLPPISATIPTSLWPFGVLAHVVHTHIFFVIFAFFFTMNNGHTEDMKWR